MTKPVTKRPATAGERASAISSVRISATDPILRGLFQEALRCQLLLSELAEITGLCKPTLAAWRDGIRPNAALTDIRCLAEALGYEIVLKKVSEPDMPTSRKEPIS